MNILWVNILGLSLIALIVWWFWLSQPKPINQEEKSEEKSDENAKGHH
jgi:plastocyanin domain-containing protein